ncbi:MAG: methylmalonyl-CoA mutase family protein, partial [Acidimicrobiales bacterium]
EGVLACIEDGWFCAEIADAAYRFQSKIASRQWVQVGVNGYIEGDEGQAQILYIDPGVEERQLAKLRAVRQARDDDAVRRCLERIAREAADPTVNLLPALVDAAKAYVTVGESMHALGTVFGTWLERSVV